VGGSASSRRRPAAASTTVSRSSRSRASSIERPSRAARRAPSRSASASAEPGAEPAQLGVGRRCGRSSARAKRRFGVHRSLGASLRRVQLAARLVQAPAQVGHLGLRRAQVRTQALGVDLRLGPRRPYLLAQPRDLRVGPRGVVDAARPAELRSGRLDQVDPPARSEQVRQRSDVYRVGRRRGGSRGDRLGQLRQRGPDPGGDPLPEHRVMLEGSSQRCGGQAGPLRGREPGLPTQRDRHLVGLQGAERVGGQREHARADGLGKRTGQAGGRPACRARHAAPTGRSTSLGGGSWRGGPCFLAAHRPASSLVPPARSPRALPRRGPRSRAYAARSFVPRNRNVAAGAAARLRVLVGGRPYRPRT
jgi:hypothetical protein